MENPTKMDDVDDDWGYPYDETETTSHGRISTPGGKCS